MTNNLFVAVINHYKLQRMKPIIIFWLKCDGMYLKFKEN